MGYENQTDMVIDLLIKKMSEYETSLNTINHRLTLLEQIMSEVTRTQTMEQQAITSLQTEMRKFQIGINALSIRQSSQSGEGSSGGRHSKVQP